MTNEELNNIKTLVTDYDYIKTARPDILQDFFIRLIQEVEGLRVAMAGKDIKDPYKD